MNTVKTIFFVTLLLLLVACQFPSRQAIQNNHPAPKPPGSFRMVVFSCYKHQKMSSDHDIWHKIQDEAPDLLVILGDLVYFDRVEKSRLQKHIDKLWRRKPFRKLVESTPYVATWDDHDAGCNNIYPLEKDKLGKKARRKCKTDSFYDRFSEVKPVYIRTVFNDENNDLLSDKLKPQILLPPLNGHEEERTVDNLVAKNLLNETTIDYAILVNGVQLIMLDGITNRRKIDNSREIAQIATEAQLDWVEERLKRHEGLSFVATGSTLQFHDGWQWKDYKSEYRRLVDMINRDKMTIMLSGDLHKNAVAYPVKEPNEPAFFELVTSGLGYSRKEMDRYLVIDIEKIEADRIRVSYLFRPEIHKTNLKRRKDNPSCINLVPDQLQEVVVKQDCRSR